MSTTRESIARAKWAIVFGIVAAVLLAVIAIVKNWNWWLEHAKAVGDAWKVWAEFLAYSGAALFFGYKLWSGYFVSNLSLSLTCKRQPGASKDTSDFLSVAVTLKAGSNGTIRLLDVKARVLEGGIPKEVVVLEDFLRLDSVEKDGREVIRSFQDVDPEVRLLNLAPGEATQMAQVFEVAAASACLVQVVVLAKRFHFRNSKIGPTMQWRASEVSLPVESRPKKPVGAAFE